MKLTIMIPAYNEEATIGSVIDEVKSVTSKQNIFYELIVVDDGSNDKTAVIAKMHGAKVIEHPYNKGYGASLKTGAKNANGEYVMYIDADGQHNPQNIPLLLKEMSKYDMVVASRQNISSTSLFRTPGKKMLSLLANYLAERKIPDLNSGFRIIKKKIILEFINILPNAFSFTTTITLACIKSGYDLKYIPVKMRYRKGGKSVINPFKDGFKFIILLFRITMLFSPLRVFIPISFFLGLIGIVHMAIGIIIFLKVPSLSVILILSATMIFFFGLLADQISMMRRENKQ